MTYKFLTIIFFIAFVQLLSCKTENKNNNQKDSTTTVTDSIAQKTKDSLELVSEIEEEAKPAYIDAYKKIMEIKTNVELAEKGDLNKSQVVADYNERLGPEMGRLSTLSQVKTRLDTAGDAYIQYKFKRACADIALSKAAEQKFNAKTFDSSKQ